MVTITYRFWRGEDGQDLVEYSLLLAFIILAAVIVMRQTGASVAPIWQTNNSLVQDAAITAS